MARGMTPMRKRAWSAVALMLVMTMAGRRPASAANALSFPTTNFAILNPVTSAVIGRARYRVVSTNDGGILHGESHYDDGTSDFETSFLQSEGVGALPKLVEFDHTFYQADGSIMVRAHLNANSGAATCIDNTGGQNNLQSSTLSIPDGTWAGASVVLPIQDFLRAGNGASAGLLHVFSCAPGPRIFSVSLQIDPENAMWAVYGGETTRVEVRPDFGWLNLIVSTFVPKLYARFDPNDGYAFVGDETSRYYKGPRIMLVKKRDGSSAAAQPAK
jgi:hypothetical protein